MSYSRNLIRFYINISVLAKRLTGWLQTGDIQKGKSKGESLKAKILTDYFAHHCLSAVEKSEQKEISVETPETIWQFWDQPAGKKTPEIVKSSLESVGKFKGDFEHKILNNATFENETDLPGYVLDRFRKGRIDYTHFSDLLRLNLLKNHGGIWLDATGYMTDLLPKYILDEDFFVFLTDEMSTFPYSFVQNCFIRAKKGSFLCDAWYRMCVEFWKNETKTLDYFQHQLIFKTLIFNHSYAKDLFDRMPHHSERATHQLTGKLLQKFDADEWERIKKASFFQKTTYKIAGGTDDSGTYFSKLCGKT